MSRYPPIPQDLIKSVLSHLESGMTQSSVAKALNISQPKVFYIKKRFLNGKVQEKDTLQDSIVDIIVQATNNTATLWHNIAMELEKVRRNRAGKPKNQQRVYNNRAKETREERFLARTVTANQMALEDNLKDVVITRELYEAARETAKLWTALAQQLKSRTEVSHGTDH